LSIEWIFDPPPPSGARKGGLANAQIFDPEIDSFVREVLQNARDQKLDGVNSVSVRFALWELAEPHLSRFLEAIRWPGLLPHLTAAAEQGGITISQRLQEGLDLVDGGSIRLLLVSDSGTNGLTGGENDEESNFNALCRHELVTSSERRDSGGSFGLGKSVLWRFSTLSTVLFGSRLSGSNTTRFFGRTLLPWHATNDSAWEGSGWLGHPEATPAGPRAVSVTGQRADDIASACLVHREADDPGTSILVVGFDEPALETERPLAGICESIAESAARWFWPALLDNEMTILVEGWENDERVFAQHAHPATKEVAPFLAARTGSPEVDEMLDSPGEVVERKLELSVPAQRHRPGHIDDPRPALMAPVRLRVRMAESGEADHINTVSLQRGTGMVVEYRDVRRRSSIDIGFHAVLEAGLAHGATDEDQAAEEFLRAAEPPAHTEWTHKTERIKAEYKAGAKGAVDGLFTSVEQAIRELARDEEVESDEGPDALRKLFPLPGVGDLEPAPYYRIHDPEGRLDDNRWEFGARYSRKEPQDDPWMFRVTLVIDQEGSGGRAAGERVPIASLSASDPSDVRGPEADESFVVTAPGDLLEVAFSGRSREIRDLPAGGLRRVRLRMEVRTIEARGGSL
jgi:hypothetical protein